MPTWELAQPHYLQTPEGEWEYSEQNRDSGKMGRKRFTVPVYFDKGTILTNVESEANERRGIFYAQFEKPTPDMIPLDDEARKLTEEVMHNYDHPIDSLPGEFSGSMLSTLERQLDEAFKRNGGIPQSPVSAPGVSREEFEKLTAQMTALMEQNAALQAKLAEGADKATPTGARRA
ncbi:MAG: hypothetical protein E6Q97_19170 [Desulfurellales bacterium]|nr:MAG: hypothetical protein E6Q97_19170 [Desulfurellales bacterium]